MKTSLFFQSATTPFVQRKRSLFFTGILLTLIGGSATAQTHSDQPHVSLHVNSSLHNCDFDISPNLTQSEWKRATREIGNAIYLDPLSSAQPLGRLHWNFQLESTSFSIDQESGAWNNTFHHPDSTHYLTETGRLMVPALRFRIGLTDRIDVGVYYTSSKPFGANYGFLGFEGRYAFLNNLESGWAATIRGSYVTDANVKDFNISSTGLDVTASKKLFNVFMPYAGMAINWNHGKIVSSEVALHPENNMGARGLVGLDFRWRFVNLGYEVQFGDGMSNRSVKLGVTF